MLLPMFRLHPEGFLNISEPTVHTVAVFCLAEGCRLTWGNRIVRQHSYVPNRNRGKSYWGAL